MEEDNILNFSPTVMFRGTPCIYIRMSFFIIQICQFWHKLLNLLSLSKIFVDFCKTYILAFFMKPYRKLQKLFRHALIKFQFSIPVSLLNLLTNFYKCYQTVNSSHRFSYLINSQFLRRVDFEMSQRIKLRFYRSNSQLCFSVALYMYILALHVYMLALLLLK